MVRVRPAGYLYFISPGRYYCYCTGDNTTTRRNNTIIYDNINPPPRRFFLFCKFFFFLSSRFALVSVRSAGPARDASIIKSCRRKINISRYHTRPVPERSRTRAVCYEHKIIFYEHRCPATILSWQRFSPDGTAPRRDITFSCPTIFYFAAKCDYFPTKKKTKKT